jgi:dsRNA-specific ribonuclease
MNKHVIISKHIEENCSGRSNQHILEDVLEAFIGALYLDCGDYNIIREFVFNLIVPKNRLYSIVKGTFV